MEQCLQVAQAGGLDGEEVVGYRGNGEGQSLNDGGGEDNDAGWVSVDEDDVLSI